MHLLQSLHLNFHLKIHLDKIPFHYPLSLHDILIHHILNPLNNNISLTNKTNGNDLANYYKSAVVLYTKDDKIQSIQIADKQFFYKLINDVFNK